MRPNPSPAATELRRRAEAELRALGAGRKHRPMMAEVSRGIAAGRRNRGREGKADGGEPRSEADSRRLLHELQVHQVELEMQNAELLEARDRMEGLFEKYTDLYDFAPVGYFSLDEQGRILEVNLTGAALLGVERSRLIHQRLPRFVAPPSQPAFLAFLARVFASPGKQVCEAELAQEDGAPFWANLHGAFALARNGPRKWCRMAVSDITALKQAQEAQQRSAALAIANRELRQEIVRRQVVEKALKRSEQHQVRLLEQSHQMQEQLRHLSHQILRAQEEERKRISRELHDDITQTLVGINVLLEALARGSDLNPEGLQRRILRTQRLVEKTVSIVHQFARELRPTALDDLGLIAALHLLLKDYTKRTGLRVRFTAFAGVDPLDSAQRIVLYRITQEALSNVASHARASRVQVSLRKLPDAVRLEISDNGRSFNVERMLRTKGSKHLGLLGMRERVEMVGGTLCIQSAPKQGTSIQAQIPFGAPGAGKERVVDKPA